MIVAIVIPSTAASDVENECHDTRASINVEVHIRPLNNSNDCILELQGSAEHVERSFFG